MKDIIIDTNVIISSLISRSFPFRIIHEIVFEYKTRTFLSEDILAEYSNVIARDKFSGYIDFKSNANFLISFLIEFSVYINPSERLNIAKDPDENKFLELANETNADYIISGNIKDFGLLKFGNTKIVTPKEFWEEFHG